MCSHNNSIILFSDFGPYGPYIGQMESVIRRIAPNAPIINLLSNAPTADPRSLSDFSSVILIR
ncbi:MAG: SAM-dependent chlorinase/fluorinase [Methylococcaceae bacterium]